VKLPCLSPRQRAFTLVEIMIVVLVVAILTGLAGVVIGRIKNRAARSLLENNLRQLYQAKEFFFAETGRTEPVGIKTLVQDGYVSEANYGRLYKGGSLENKMGWHYGRRFVVGEPAYAFQGEKQRGQAPTKEVIYYPGPPSSPQVLFTDANPGQTTPIISTQAKPEPVVTVQTVVPQSNTQTPDIPVTSGTTSSAGSNQPPAQSSANQGGSGTPSNQNQGNQHSGAGPGNSDFGHSHNQPHNQGHGKP